MKENIIYKTTDFDSFVFRNANRDIDSAHVKRIADNMSANGWIGAPIEVSLTENGKYQIEDGQHRYMACKETNTPVNFMLVKPKTIYDLATQNSIKKSWTPMDYINAYADDGSYSYKRLKNLAEGFKNVSIGDVLRVIGDGGKNREKLRRGYVQITDEQFYMAREVLKSLDVINESIDNSNIKTKSNYKNCIISLLKHNVVDPQRLIDKLDKHGNMLLPTSASRTQALQYLEMLYNYHQPKNTCVLFREALKNV